MSRADLVWRLVAAVSDAKEGVEEKCHHHLWTFSDTSDLVANVCNVTIVESAFYPIPALFPTYLRKRPPGPLLFLTKKADKRMQALYVNRQVLTLRTICTTTSPKTKHQRVPWELASENRSHPAPASHRTCILTLKHTRHREPSLAGKLSHPSITLRTYRTGQDRLGR